MSAGALGMETPRESVLACLRAFEVRIRPLDELKVKLLGLRLHVDTLDALDRLT